MSDGYGYDEAMATEFHNRRNDMRRKMMEVLNRWFNGALKIDPESEMVMQLTDAALGLGAPVAAKDIPHGSQ